MKTSNTSNTTVPLNGSLYAGVTAHPFTSPSAAGGAALPFTGTTFTTGTSSSGSGIWRPPSSAPDIVRWPQNNRSWGREAFLDDCLRFGFTAEDIIRVEEACGLSHERDEDMAPLLQKLRAYRGI